MALWCNPLALKSEQSCGVCSIHDRIPPLERPLMAFNFSLRKGIFPDVWELARVTPIFKSGSKSEANNYRPISVISVLSRILGILVHDQVCEYLKASKVLKNESISLPKICSRITSLIDSTDYWHEIIYLNNLISQY